MNPKKIFITGGHLTPAKAVFEELTGWEIYYLGRKYAMEDDKAVALEYQQLGDSPNIKYLVITAGRLQRKFFINIGQSVKALLKIPVGFMQSFWWLLRFEPNIVLSFGGYIALPVVINAWLLGIPVITHEQTQTLGLANKIIGLFSQKILRGSILRREILKAKTRTTETIFITGGNQGAHVINVAVEGIINDLTKKYQVIHQTGDSSYQDFEKLSANANKNYQVKKFLSSSEMAKTLALAKIVISRSGANTVSELAYLGKPAILTPIPWSSGGEQKKNAQVLVDLGMAEIIVQKNLSGKSLLSVVNKISDNYEPYFNNAKKAKSLIDPHAAEKIVAELEKIVLAK